MARCLLALIWSLALYGAGCHSLYAAPPVIEHVEVEHSRTMDGTSNVSFGETAAVTMRGADGAADIASVTVRDLYGYDRVILPNSPSDREWEVVSADTVQVTLWGATLSPSDPQDYVITAADGQSGTAPAELLARAAQAVVKARSLHVVHDVTGTAPYRWEEWQEGDLYRRDNTPRLHFFLNTSWAINYDESANVAIAARQRPDDSSMYATTRVLSALRVGGPNTPPRTQEELGAIAERRIYEGSAQFGVRITQRWRPQFPDEAAESDREIWIQAGTWLPVEFDYKTRDSSGKIIGGGTDRYEYNMSIPGDFLAWSSVLRKDAVIVGWEHLHELENKPAVAIQTLKGEYGEVAVEVRNVERLPEDCLLVTGYVSGAEPEWLGAHVTVRDGNVVREYRLTQDNALGPAPWGWGSSGPPRLHFYMIFSRARVGWCSGPAPQVPTITFRAWGLVDYVPPRETKRNQTTFTVEMGLPTPSGPPLEHELQRILQRR